MIELREAFKQAGLRQQEREITYAIVRMRTRRANPIEGGLRYILFEVTSDYGLSYGRPLLIILGLILAFAFPYMAAIRRPGRGKVVRVDPEAENVTTTVVPVLIVARGPRTRGTDIDVAQIVTVTRQMLRH